MSAEDDQSDAARPIPEEAQHVRDRFWEKVDRGSEDECWEWQSCTHRRGYGHFWYSGRPRKAHRISYRMHKGAIPPGKQINHHCDNPSCVNPSHLYAGSAQENAQDAVRRERLDTALSHDDVREIRRRYAEEDVYQYELAEEFDVDQGTISRVVNRRTHDYVE